MVEFGREKDIKKEIKETLKLIKQEKNNNARLMFYNYIGNLYSALSVIKGKKMYPNERRIFGNLDNYHRFIKRTDFLMDRFTDNFIANQEFHQNYFYDLLFGIESTFIKNIDGSEYSKQSDYFGEVDFLIVFHDFCQSLNLEKLFFEIFNRRRIFKMTKGKEIDNYLGLNLHNIVTGESKILIDSFDYNLDSMFTLAHEMGHYYDQLEFVGRDKIDDYVSYFFKSLYGEVISRLFERLFLTYLVEENIMREKAVDKLIDIEIGNHDFLLSSYILSLLESEYLSKNKYMNMSTIGISQMVGKYFMNSEVIEDYLKTAKLDLTSDVTYTYGDIVSMFLKEEVLAEGLDSTLMKKFNEIRCFEFNTEFFLEEKLSPEKYVKLYEREVQLIKK